MQGPIHISRTRKTIVLLLFLCAVASSVKARPRAAWTFAEMFEKSDLVVIARVVTAENKSESVSLPGFDTPLKVFEVLTQFESRIVLKGPKSITTFRLRHFRYRSEQEELAMANNPQLVTINSGEHPAFLLFLLKESGDVYVPFGGQVDPAALSVLDLRGGGD